MTGSRLPNYGRVEVFSNQTWVAVCDQGFSMQAARVVCRDMGYTEARPQCCSALGPLVSYSYSLTASTIGLVVYQCNGNESSLLHCNVSTTATCMSGKYTSVLCSNDPIQETGKLLELSKIHHVTWRCNFFVMLSEICMDSTCYMKVSFVMLSILCADSTMKSSKQERRDFATVRTHLWG